MSLCRVFPVCICTSQNFSLHYNCTRFAVLLPSLSVFVLQILNELIESDAVERVEWISYLGRIHLQVWYIEDSCDL